MYQTAKEESLKFGTRKPKISAKKRKNPEKKKKHPNNFYIQHLHFFEG